MPLTTVSSGMLDSTAQYYSFKNRIINGDMRIDQRGSASSPINNSAAVNTYITDRFALYGTSATRMSGQQSTTTTTNFVNSLLITSSAATTPAAGDAYGVRQVIEGTNIGDLNWGTANASTVTLSFWVRSSITGTYALSLFNRDSPNRSYVATYTINSANTFEYKTITIAGETTGTWLTTTGQGIQVWWDLGSGSNFNTTAGVWQSSLVVRTSGSANWIGTNGATFYITGVQLEKGSTATSFDYRPYGTELALCQRYYEANSGDAIIWSGDATTGNTYYVGGLFAVPKRATPTMTGTLSANVSGFTSAVVGATINSYILGSNCNASGARRYFYLAFTASAEL